MAGFIYIASNQASYHGRTAQRQLTTQTHLPPPVINGRPDLEDSALVFSL